MDQAGILAAIEETADQCGPDLIEAANSNWGDCEIGGDVLIDLACRYDGFLAALRELGEDERQIVDEYAETVAKSIF